MNYQKMLSKLRFDEKTAGAAERKMRKDKNIIRKIAKTAYCGEEFDFFLCRRAPLTRLTTVIYLLCEKYEEYKLLGVCGEVIFDTFRDVSLRAFLFLERTGKTGISKDDVIWFRHIMNIEIFKIGTLQFQPFKMIYLDKETLGEDYMTFSKEQKEMLPDGTPVINCHVQRNANISFASVYKSFNEAGAFFKEHFPKTDYKAFLCYSWLLYPPMLKKLSEGSNIRQFAGRFDIIGSCGDSEQATENLFEGKRAKKRKKLTSLQKLALEHKEILGYGCGIIRI